MIKKTVIVFVTLLLLGIIFYVFLYPSLFRLKDNSRQKYTPTVISNKNMLESELKRKTSFSISEVDRSIESSIQELDKELFFVNDFSSTTKNINKELYNDGSSGWSIDFSLSNNLKDSYDQIVRKIEIYGKSFKIIFAARADLSAVITAEDSKYKIKVTLEYLSSSSTKINVVIQKKS
jgi:hypothetical protein